MPKLSRSEAAYLLGVSTDTLRRWEKEGKITSSRTEGGHRTQILHLIREKSKPSSFNQGLTVSN